ncbi:hypothetical protein U472_00030 [Orenia metallireducens]|uniref:Methyl-accepting transducer domain-containing protein n=1 Tax=Orenia metallireducens TaxID=1413210 RepID=A0A1C0ADI5_9FIRM|nr:methyl-accepting chemotaxis protein [Orenia metallireducens]OCL28744.1 hypothetical protein U472_00030 [Orenia metallireducens]
MKIIKRLKSLKSLKRSNFTIFSEVRLAFILLLVIIICMGTFIFYDTNKINNEVEDLKEEIIPMVQLDKELSNNLVSRQKRIYAWNSGLGGLSLGQNTIETEILDLKSYLKTDEEINIIDDLAKLNLEVKNKMIKLDKTLTNGLERKAYLREIDKLNFKIDIAFAKLNTYIWNNLEKKINIITNSTYSIKLRIILMTIINLLIGLILGIIINKHINKVTSNIRTETKEAALKSKTITHSATKMKEISDFVGQQVTKASEFIKVLMLGNENLSIAVKEVSIAINQMAAGIGDLAEKSEEVSKVGKDTYHLFQNTQSKIEWGNRIINQTVEDMKKLQMSINKISEISNKIMKITEQTNLLALNAAIEASRAGKYGQGFTVVAEEIKSLADESKTATGEVKIIVDEIETVAKQTLSNMTAEDSSTDNSIINLFVEINNLSKEVSEKMAQVIDLSEEQLAFNEQAEASSQEISASSEESLAQTEEVCSFADNMEEIIFELTEFNSKLHSKIEEQVDSSQQQLELINKVVQANTKLKKN